MAHSKIIEQVWLPNAGRTVRRTRILTLILSDLHGARGSLIEEAERKPASPGEKTVKAYVISEVEALDPELFEKYRELAHAAVTKYGGRYIVRGGAIETVEGENSSGRIVIIAFPGIEAARQWYRSAEYAEALTLSRKALKRRLIFVGGAPQSP
jgi:uncharacterized protein (DUF1330 family)